MHRFVRTFTLAAAALFASAQAEAALGDDIVVASDGHVIVTFVGSNAAFESALRLGLAGTDFSDNKTTPIGTTFDLGSFTAGTTLDIVLHVLTTGNFFHTGPAAGNPDSVAHANLIYGYLGTPGLTFVGFEDIFGGGDFDYNDLQFTFTNISAPVSEPETYALMLAGLGALGWLGRRRRADRR